jgi:hypothetical protein
MLLRGTMCASVLVSVNLVTLLYDENADTLSSTSSSHGFEHRSH